MTRVRGIFLRYKVRKSPLDPKTFRHGTSTGNIFTVKGRDFQGGELKKRYDLCTG